MIHTKPHRATNGVLTSSQCYSAQSKQSLVKHEPTHSWPYQTTHPVTGRTRTSCRDCSDDEANADAIHNVCIKH